jgi:hypothetical protein
MSGGRLILIKFCLDTPRDLWANAIKPALGCANAPTDWPYISSVRADFSAV